MVRRLSLVTLLVTGSALAQDPAPSEPVPPPAAEAQPAAEAPEAPKGPDVTALSQELSIVLDELTQARARASVLVKALFRTQVEVWVARRADDQRMQKLVLKLDGIPVHDSDGAAVQRDEARLYAGHAAPGVHELTVLVTETAKQNPAYTYTREERFRFEIKRDTNTRIELLMRDDSDMAEELPEDDEGEYMVSTRVRIERTKLEK